MPYHLQSNSCPVMNTLPNKLNLGVRDKTTRLRIWEGSGGGWEKISFFGINALFFEKFPLGEIYIIKFTIFFFSILSVQFSMLLCSYHHHPFPELSHQPTPNPSPLSITPHSSCPWSPVTSALLPVSMDLTILGTSSECLPAAGLFHSASCPQGIVVL